MLFIVGGLALIILLIRAFVSIMEAYNRLRCFEMELEATHPVVNHQLSSEYPFSTEPMREAADSLEAASLTASLLSAVKVHSQKQHHSVKVPSTGTNTSVE